MPDIPQPKKGLPANNLEYQPRWGEPNFVPHERDSTPQRVEKLLQYINVYDKKVLDIGCNNGYFCFELEKNGAKCFGLDYYEPAIKVCKEIAEKHKMNAQFEVLDLNTERDRLYFILTNFQPDIILCNSIFHHMNDPDSLLEILALSAKTMIVEFQFDKYEDYEKWVRKWTDSRTQLTRLPDNWYNRQLQKDETGLHRAVMKIEDVHVDRKWIHYHDDKNLIRFELIENMVRKYHYMGKHNQFMYELPYIQGNRLENITIPSEYLREKLIELLYQLAKRGVIHCELYRHIWLNNGEFHILDWDTQYNVIKDYFEEFYNTKIRLNLSFGCMREANWTLDKILNRDLDDINKYFIQFKYPPLTNQEKRKYFELLLEQCIKEEIHWNEIEISRMIKRCILKK